MMKPIILFLVLLIASPVLADVFFSENFDDGSYDTPTVDGGSFYDNSSSNQNYTDVNTNIAHSGQYSVEFYWRPELNDGSTGGQAQLEFELDNEIEEVYLRFYIYFPDGTENPSVGPAYVHRENISTGENNKLFRIWPNPNNVREQYYNYGKWGGTLNWDESTGSKVTPRGNDSDGCADNSNLEPYYYIYDIGSDYNNLGRWIALEFHVKSDDGTGNGIYQAWVDGTEVVNYTGIVTSGAPCYPRLFKHGYLLGASNSSFTVGTSIYIDDVAFSDEYIGLLDDPSAYDWCLDSDGDDYYTGSCVNQENDPGTGWELLSSLTGGSDCNDSDATFNPTATQVCGNGLDEQTCGVIDDTCPTTSTITAYSLTNGDVTRYKLTTE